MGFNSAHRCTQNEHNGSGFDFIRGIPQNDNEFLSHIVQVTDDETWASFVNVETKEQ
jgi:hypothetical protein